MAPGKLATVPVGCPVNLRYKYRYFKIILALPLFLRPAHQDWGRARTAGNRFARDDKEPGPSWGKQLPGEQPRETAET